MQLVLLPGVFALKCDWRFYWVCSTATGVTATEVVQVQLKCTNPLQTCNCVLTTGLPHQQALSRFKSTTPIKWPHSGTNQHRKRKRRVLFLRPGHSNEPSQGYFLFKQEWCAGGALRVHSLLRQQQGDGRLPLLEAGLLEGSPAGQTLPHLCPLRRRPGSLPVRESCCCLILRRWSFKLFFFV